MIALWVRGEQADKRTEQVRMPLLRGIEKNEVAAAAVHVVSYKPYAKRGSCMHTAGSDEAL
jgi:hypothetical protein